MKEYKRYLLELFNQSLSSHSTMMDSDIFWEIVQKYVPKSNQENFKKFFDNPENIKDLNIKYNILGEYLPSTKLDPEEFPEARVANITYGNKTNDPEVNLKFLMSLPFDLNKEDAEKIIEEINDMANEIVDDVMSKLDNNF